MNSSTLAVDSEKLQAAILGAMVEMHFCASTLDVLSKGTFDAKEQLRSIAKFSKLGKPLKNHRLKLAADSLDELKGQISELEVDNSHALLRYPAMVKNLSNLRMFLNG